ncbi:hypothetical protein SUGI_0934850 [Cryptomeria japonica]|nr:hypothetical protein SUGI_0934850 [Cryptomeria japonica]
MDSISFGGWEEENEIGNGFERSASSATTSSSAMRAYDVFINHRGIDTKRTIASTIYHTLDCMGLRVFLDKEELQLGDFLPATINYAMRSASLHIAIFSKKYAQSPWCLAELSFMLKTGTKIIPIFYDVQPRDLRWVGRGGSIYASSFAQHEKSGRYSSLQLDQWKSALHNVSFYCGWELNKLNNDEGRLLKNIVNVVLEVVKNVPLEVAKHPVGLDETVADFEEAAFKSVECTENVKIVGIVGMGGCGKTTLAKDLYNRKISSFQGSSFLFDVRDAAAKNMLHKLQKKLLEDLLHVTGLTFDSISQGKGVLAYRLRFIRVLIVLDDIDHMDQIDALLPAKDNLGAGSLIIVTTRDMEVLTCSSIKSIYKMGGLDRSNARQIFCWHAFLQPCPTHGFEDLVEQFLNACNGLPLSLKVLGGHLYGKSKVYWKSQLQKISRILPDNIKQKLRVSYDALDEEEQEIFLDIACFFIGEKKGLAITIWDGSGWSGLHSLETLVNKSLVELDYRNHIRMHDHLRDLGREIATKQTPCRFWFQFQKQPKERLPIRGIMAAITIYADFEEYPHCMSHYTPPFQDCMKLLVGNTSNTTSSLGLQLLVVKGNYFSQQFAELSRDLLWLRWFDFQHTRLPSWLSLRNLNVLELHDAGALEDLWEPNGDAPFPELRELIITSSPDKFILQSFPTSIGSLEHLKKMALLGGLNSGEFKIRGLPEEFSNLQSLEHLELRYCTMLASLPTHFGDLTNLRHVDLYFCKQLTALPVSFKQLTQLQYLDLSVCLNLTLKNDILENITKLEVLKFTFCQKLHELPHKLTNQAYLRELYLDGTSIKELPANIDKLSKLEVLKVGSPFLRSLPMSLGNLSCLTRLTINHCPKLKYLPESLGHLGHLEYLKLGWSELDELPSFENLNSLKELDIEVSSQVSIIQGFEHLRSLEMLTLNTFWNQPGIRSLEGTDRLKRLQLVANTRSALETCIGTIQRWPCEMTIAGRAVRNVDSIVNSLAFPNLNVVDKLTLVEDASMVQDGWWMLQFPETCLRNATAIIIFFVVHCYQDTSFLVSVRRELDGLSGSSCSSMRLRQGKWLYIGVFAEGSLLMEDLKNSFVDAIEVDHQPEKYVIEKGMAVIMSKGKECKRVHAFYQILALLEHCH